MNIFKIHQDQPSQQPRRGRRCFYFGFFRWRTNANQYRRPTPPPAPPPLPPAKNGRWYCFCATEWTSTNKLVPSQAKTTRQLSSSIVRKWKNKSARKRGIMGMWLMRNHGDKCDWWANRIQSIFCKENLCIFSLSFVLCFIFYLCFKLYFGQSFKLGTKGDWSTQSNCFLQDWILNK